jgi:N-acetyltransferase 10
LGSCDDCLVLDDELNVLPISRGKDIAPLEDNTSKSKNKEESELHELKDQLSDTKPIGELVKLAKTIDQVCNVSNNLFNCRSYVVNDRLKLF